MFTGIIEETGIINSKLSHTIEIRANKVIQGTKLGDSISVNGVCLTVVDIKADTFSADISPETYQVTALKYLHSGAKVNLERAAAVGDRLGGHIVSGHIDDVCKLIKIAKNEKFYTLEIELKPELTKYIVKKGSVALNGISLTVADIDKNIIKIAVIPHTYEKTNLNTIKIGDYLNIETDILAKYVEKFLSTSDNKSGISMEFLQENGF